MKRIVKCSSSADNMYDIDIRSPFDIDKAHVSHEIQKILEPASSYVREVQVNIGTLSVCDIRIYSRNGAAQLRVTNPSKRPTTAIPALLRSLESRLPEFIAANEAKLNKVKFNVNQSKVRKLIKDTFGIVPFATYKQAHGYKMQYTPEDVAHIVDPNVDGFCSGSRTALNEGVSRIKQAIADAGLGSVCDTGINEMYHRLLEIYVDEDF